MGVCTARNGNALQSTAFVQGVVYSIPQNCNSQSKRFIHVWLLPHIPPPTSSKGATYAGLRAYRVPSRLCAFVCGVSSSAMNTTIFTVSSVIFLTPMHLHACFHELVYMCVLASSFKGTRHIVLRFLSTPESVAKEKSLAKGSLTFSRN